MKTGTILLDTYRTLVDRVENAVGGALTEGSSYIIDQDTRPPAVRTAATWWRPVPQALAAIDATLSSLTQAIFQAALDPDLTNEAKSRKVSEVTAAARASVEGVATDILERTHKLLTSLRVASYPPRPGTADAAQETALIGIKADLQMLLSGASDGDLVTAMGDRLGRALADDDKLTAWVLASSRWGEDYLVSRRLDVELSPLWAGTVSRVLDQAAPSDLAGVRRTYRIVSDPQNGIPVLDTLLNSTIRQVLNEAADTTGKTPVVSSGVVVGVNTR